MLKNCFCPIPFSGGIGGKMHAFVMTHFQINVFRADDFMTRFASRLEFEIFKIRRKQRIRIVSPMIAVCLALPR